MFRLLLGKNPDNMLTIYCQERRLKQDMPIRGDDIDVGDRQELFVPVELVFDALIAPNVNVPAQQMRGRLYGCIDGMLGDDIGENLAFFIVFDRHVASCERDPSRKIATSLAVAVVDRNDFKVYPKSPEIYFSFSLIDLERKNRAALTMSAARVLRISAAVSAGYLSVIGWWRLLASAKFPPM